MSCIFCIFCIFCTLHNKCINRQSILVNSFIFQQGRDIKFQQGCYSVTCWHAGLGPIKKKREEEKRSNSCFLNLPFLFVFVEYWKASIWASPWAQMTWVIHRARVSPVVCAHALVSKYTCMVWHTMVYYFVVCYLMVYYGSVVCTHVLMSKCSFPSPSFVETSKVTTFRPLFRQMFKSMFRQMFKSLFKPMFKPTYSLLTVIQL